MVVGDTVSNLIEIDAANANSISVGNTTSLTFTSTATWGPFSLGVSANNEVIFVAASNGSGTVSSISDANLTWNKVGIVTSVGTNNRLEVWKAFAASGLTDTPTFTMTGSMTGVGIMFSVTNVDTVYPIDLTATVSNGGNNASPILNLINTIPVGMVAGIFSTKTGSNTTTTPGTGFSIAIEANNGTTTTKGVVITETVTTSGQNQVTLTWSTGQIWSGMALFFVNKATAAPNTIAQVIQPSSPTEWDIHNFYFSQPCLIVKTDGVNGVLIGGSSNASGGGGQMLYYFVRVTNSNYLIVVNASNSVMTFGYDGIQTK